MCAMRPLSRTRGKPESGQAGLDDNAGADAETAREAMLRVDGGSRLPGLKRDFVASRRDKGQPLHMLVVKARCSSARRKAGQRRASTMPPCR